MMTPAFLEQPWRTGRVVRPPPHGAQMDGGRGGGGGALCCCFRLCWCCCCHCCYCCWRGAAESPHRWRTTTPESAGNSHPS
eukprot:scaffold281159_cov17-Tisochrysis_lutea.AAC.1